MELNIRRISERLILDVNVREFDGSLASTFKQQAKELIGDEQHVIMDLSQVEFVDSSAMGALISITRHVRQNGGDLKLAAVSQRVMVAFELIRLQKSINVYPTVEAATAAFRDSER